MAYRGIAHIFDAFTADTGIQVHWTDISSGQVLENTRRGATPIGDVWLGGGVDSFIAAQRDGLLQPYISPHAANAPALFRDPRGYWSGVSVVTVNFLVNTRRAAELGAPAPRSFADLLHPKLAGEISMSDPAASGTAYTVIAGILQTMGEDQGWAYLEKLHSQIKDFAVRGNEPARKVLAGEAIVGLCPDAGEDLRRAPPEVEAVYPAEGVPWWPSPVAIFKGAPRPAAARLLVDWALSPRGQSVLRDAAPRFPARSDVPPPAELGEFSDVKLMNLDFVLMGLSRDNLVREWTTRFATP